MNQAGVVQIAQYLTFTLNGEFFAVHIAKIREVLEFGTITKVPGTPGFVLGVINLRGTVVPVVDLRRKFGMSAVATTIDTCVVIGEVDIDDRTVVLGALVDSVEEVLELDETTIEPPPSLGASLNTAFIEGMGRRDDKFIIILDIDKVFSSTELAVMQETGSTADV